MNAIAILTIIFACLTCLTVVASLLFDWKIKNISLYPYLSAIGAIICLLLNISDFKEITSVLFSNSSINPLKILVFFLSMTILSITLDNLNFFNYLALKCTKLSKNNQKSLFLIFYLVVSFLTIFTSNDIVILAFVPFICYFCKNSGINPTPYVFSTFVAANTWSMTFVIGNPTNVYISSFANIGFVEYFLKMILPTIAGSIISLFVMLIIFRKQLREKIEAPVHEEIIINKPLIILNVCFLTICTLILAISSYIGLEMWYIALGFAGLEIFINLIICLAKKSDKSYISNTLKRVPWAFIPFLVSMFLIIMCLNSNGITKIIYQYFNKGDSVFVYGITSFLLSNLMNNIPMTTLFTSILQSGTLNMQSAYATIIGSNLGAILSPVGALAGIMFMKILKDKQVDFKILDFIKYGAIISIISVFATLGTLYFL